jgi:hypothetical protein
MVTEVITDVNRRYHTLTCRWRVPHFSLVLGEVGKEKQTVSRTLTFKFVVTTSAQVGQKWGTPRLSCHFFSDAFDPVSAFALLSFFTESLLESPFPSEDSDFADPLAGFFA